MLLPRILLCLGVAAGTLSIWDTLSHTWDPSYQAPALALGPTHTNYHAFREFMLSVGAVLVELYGVFQPAAKRTRPLWIAMCLTALFYYGGWWLPWPLFGLRTPNLVATVDHLIATILCLAGVGLAWPYFSDKSELRED
jgi:hypothetical protein